MSGISLLGNDKMVGMHDGYMMEDIIQKDSSNLKKRYMSSMMHEMQKEEKDFSLENK